MHLLTSENPEIRGHTVYVVMNICRDHPENWSQLIALGGVRVLAAMASSINQEAQQAAIHEIAELSVNVEKHADIVTHALPLLLSSLAEDPANGRPKGSSLQLESLLVVANLSHDSKVQNARNFMTKILT